MDAGNPAVTTEEAPQVIVTDRKRKPKQKASRELKQILKIERGFAKASSRVSKGVASGLARYVERRDRSAERRRDGALRDAPLNWARGVDKAVRVASRAPVDLAKSVNSKRVTKNIRRAVRNFMRPFSG
jgi:hypothetical protein